MTTQTPAEVLPSLNRATEAMEAELIANLSKHAENTFSTASATIERALAALKPLEEALDEADRLLEQSVQDALQRIKDSVREAVQQMDAPLDKIGQASAPQRETRDAKRRAKKKKA